MNTALASSERMTGLYIETRKAYGAGSFGPSKRHIVVPESQALRIAQEYADHATLPPEYAPTLVRGEHFVSQSEVRVMMAGKPIITVKPA